MTHYLIKTFSMELVMVDGSPATPAVLYQALRDEDAEVRVCAAFSLAKAGDLSPNVIDTLFAATDWRSDPEAGDRARHGVITLSETNPAIRALLIAALQRHALPLSGVAQCLGEIGQATPAVIDGLVAFTQQSADLYATASALSSLIQLGYESAELIERLFALYQRGDVIVRTVVLDALPLLQEPPPQAIDLLLVALRRGKANASAAARGLARIGLAHPQVIEALLDASHARDWAIRDAAIAALAKVPDPSPAVAAALYQALSDQNSFVRMQAIAGVAQMRTANSVVIDQLLAMLAEAEQQAQQPKAQTNPNVAPDEAAPTPFAVLQELENMNHLRSNIAIALAQLGYINDAVIAAFLAELGDDDASVRERIARNWWLLGNDHPAAVAALQRARQDESALVRASAVASWQRLGQG